MHQASLESACILPCPDVASGVVANAAAGCVASLTRSKYADTPNSNLTIEVTAKRKASLKAVKNSLSVLPLLHCAAKQLALKVQPLCRFPTKQAERACSPA